MQPTLASGTVCLLDRTAYAAHPVRRGDIDGYLDVRRVLQLPSYGVCASQHLAGRHGRTWEVSRAGYVAFRERNAFVPLGGSSPLDKALDFISRDPDGCFWR